MKPPANNCAVCIKVARRTERPRVVATAVTSPSGKAHWRDAQGYTFCGKYARNAGWSA